MGNAACGGTGALRRCAAAGRVSRFRARVPFFFCQKKGTKENHLNLRFKDPLARRGVYEFGSMYSRMKYVGYHCRSKGLCLRSPARRLARPLASATVGAIFFYRMGDYQIAPKPPGGGFGRWRLTPPGSLKRRLRGGTRALRRCAATPHPALRATCLPAGRSVRGSDRPPACHSTPRTPQGGRLKWVRRSTPRTSQREGFGLRLEVRASMQRRISAQTPLKSLITSALE